MVEDSTSGSDGSDSSGDLALDTVFHLLSHRRRRYVLSCLSAHGPTVALPDVADDVATREYETSIVDIPEEDVLEVYLSLYHTHVPKLVEAGVVSYDQERDLVTREPLADELERIYQRTEPITEADDD